MRPIRPPPSSPHPRLRAQPRTRPNRPNRDFFSSARLTKDTSYAPLARDAILRIIGRFGAVPEMKRRSQRHARAGWCFSASTAPNRRKKTGFRPIFDQIGPDSLRPNLQTSKPPNGAQSGRPATANGPPAPLAPAVGRMRPHRARSPPPPRSTARCGPPWPRFGLDSLRPNLQTSKRPDGQTAAAAADRRPAKGPAGPLRPTECRLGPSAARSTAAARPAARRGPDSV